jgi:hypothetical protein
VDAGESDPLLEAMIVNNTKESKSAQISSGILGWRGGR